ncbi:unnamed protein product [Sphagnum jensenii]|uniref:SMODS and SLOG-associating 2TM effector domain-containing protein n=1 Tax=Sphagnum jensenii TaxID=128206 RepID=A0ABP1BIU2_9BRYO
MAEAAVEKEFSVVVNIGRNIEEQDGASSYTLRYSETRALLPERDRSEIELAPAASAEKKEVLVLVNPNEIEADRLLEIDSVPKLKLILTEWEKRFEVSSLRIEKKNTRSINAKNELYQLIGFYSVFQGVVLTAVAQTSLIQCQQSWGPVSLSLLASIATIVSVYTKLKDYSDHRKSLEEETASSKILDSCISKLKEEGKNFKFPDIQDRKKTSKGLEPLYIVAVILALILFSGITLASCFAILCQNRHTSPSSAPPSAPPSASLSSPPAA